MPPARRQRCPRISPGYFQRLGFRKNLWLSSVMMPSASPRLGTRIFFARTAFETARKISAAGTIVSARTDNRHVFRVSRPFRKFRVHAFHIVFFHRAFHLSDGSDRVRGVSDPFASHDKRKLGRTAPDIDKQVVVAQMGKVQALVAHAR